MIRTPDDIWGTNAFQAVVDQVSEPRALDILGVRRPLLRRWLSGSVPVPRMAVLALYWESPFGRAMIDSHNVLQMHYQQHEIYRLQKENARLRASIGELVAAGNFGCANDFVALD